MKWEKEGQARRGLGGEETAGMLTEGDGFSAFILHV